MSVDILISVMLPTRQRTHLVERSVSSLLETAQDPNCIEICVAYDCDDNESKQYFNSVQWRNTIGSAQSQVFETPNWGYVNLHNYYNLLAEKSQGQWLFLWNDDAVMKSQAWDQQVRANRDFFGMLHMGTQNFSSSLTLFPLIPRTWLDVFETLSLCNLCDSWIQDICTEAGAVKSVAAEIFHDRYDVTGNNNDSTYQNRNYQKKIYKSDAMRAVRSQWAQQFVNYAQSHRM